MDTGFFYHNCHELMDGNILLYTRSDTQKPIYQCRLKLKGVDGYIIKSTKTRVFADKSISLLNFSSNT